MFDHHVVDRMLSIRTILSDRRRRDVTWAP
jgi:hypothetical protein